MLLWCTPTLLWSTSRYYGQHPHYHCRPQSYYGKLLLRYYDRPPRYYLGVSELCLRRVLVGPHAIMIMVNPHTTMVDPHAIVVNPQAIVVDPHAIVVDPHDIMFDSRTIMVDPQPIMVDSHANMVHPQSIMVKRYYGRPPRYYS